MKEREGVSGELKLKLNQKIKEFTDLERTMNQTIKQKDIDLAQLQKKLDSANSRIDKLSKDFKALSERKVCYNPAHCYIG